MNKKSILALAGVCALLAAALAGSSAASRADEARAMSKPHTLHYVHLYSDAAGVSHFRDEKVTLSASAASSASLSAPSELLAYTLSDARGATALLLKRGAREDWHRAPRRMWLIVVQGAAQVTASDGEVRRFGLGSVLLMDDAAGKGHITQAVGRVDHIAITIPAPAK